MRKERKTLIIIAMTTLLFWNVAIGAITGLFRYTQGAFTTDHSVQWCLEMSYIEPLSKPGVVIACYLIQLGGH